MVVTIRDSLEVSAPLDRVWDIVADVDNDPKHRPNIRTVNNISKDGNVIEREVTDPSLISIIHLCLEKYHEMLLGAESVLGYFGFDRTVYGDTANKHRKW
ncbi:MAG: hypothetical protein DLM72_21030 [Candidatus Nitrosopolaris wilkensis]|nr:MAG: hypothetical protein DLM72_21030 [Candidatus Nitrosopolaris wilkensis]